MTKPHKQVTATARILRLVFAKRTPGVCRVCGCTMTDPCYNPGYGSCWWADADETICSHCYHKEIFKDPATEHCVNTKNHIEIGGRRILGAANIKLTEQ